MKKNKIIIPAMAMILFSTAASISGTVAWFTASRVFETTVGQFSVVETEGSLDCVMTPIGLAGTKKADTDNAVKVIDDTVTPVATFTKGDADPGTAPDGAYFYNTTGEGQMKKGNGTAWAPFAMTPDAYYQLKDGPAYRAKTTAVLDMDDPRTLNPVVLTHGSIAHTGTYKTHAFLIDSDDTSSFLDRGVQRGAGDWSYQEGLTLKDTSPEPANKTVDIYVAVAWEMEFTYNFATDTTPVAVYLDLGKSKFNVPATPNPKFTKTAIDGKEAFDTAKGFRIGFYGGDHEVVWGNNEALQEAPTPYAPTEKTYAKGDIVRQGNNVYKCNQASIAAPAGEFDAAKWELLYSISDFVVGKEYKVGDKVVNAGKVYKRLEAGTSAAWSASEAEKWECLSGTAYSTAKSYDIGDKVVYGDKIYACKTAIVYDGEHAHPWNEEEWTLSGNVKFASGYANYADSTPYSAGDIVNRGGMLYQRKVTGTPLSWNASEWKVYESSDLRYVDSTGTTKFYDNTQYVVSNNGYKRLENGSATEPATWNSTFSAPERICTLSNATPGTTNKAKITCIAWYEGTDPNVISGAAMACLSADITVYARTTNG